MRKNLFGVLLVLLVLFIATFQNCGRIIWFTSDSNISSNNNTRGLEFEKHVDAAIPTETTGKSAAEILFVIDDSQSMKPVHTKVASAFNGFLQKLKTEGVSDWRIAITTAKVDPQNPRGSNGNLLPFENKELFLSPATVDPGRLFSKAVIFTDLSSRRSRGFHVAYDAFEKNKDTFFRPTSHHILIMVSDEDNLGSYDVYQSALAAYLKDPSLSKDSFDERDIGQKLSQYHLTKYPNAGLSFHSIILPKSAERCSLGGENKATTNGISYQAFSENTGGTVSSNCDTQYTDALNKIVIENIAQKGKIEKFNLQCMPFVGTFTDSAGTVNYEIIVENEKGQRYLEGTSFILFGTQILFTKPVEEKLTIKYSCLK